MAQFIVEVKVMGLRNGAPSLWVGGGLGSSFLFSALLRERVLPEKAEVGKCELAIVCVGPATVSFVLRLVAVVVQWDGTK